MKSVRIAYKKVGDARFISHLDMNRYWARTLRKAEIPLWYTEGFNPHIYTRFAMPLSLGFESEYEIMDFRLLDEDMPLGEIMSKINSISPEIIGVTDIWEPVKDFSAISYAGYRIEITGNSNVTDLLNDFFAQKDILVTKTNKKGVATEFDILPLIEKLRTEQINDGAAVMFTLPAGNVKNINPTLVTEAFLQKCGIPLQIAVTRKMLFDGDKNEFK